MQAHVPRSAARGDVREQRVEQAVGRVDGRLDVRLVPELAQRVARDRADRDDPRAVERARPPSWKKRTDEALVKVA